MTSKAKEMTRNVKSENEMAWKKEISAMKMKAMNESGGIKKKVARKKIA